MARVWPALEKIAIDHAIAEPVAAAGGVAVVPGTFGWDDIGDFNSLAALLPSADDAGNKVVGNQAGGDGAGVLRIEAGGTVVVPGSGRVIALLGVDDLVVVDTPDALLVTTRARAQQVKSVVDVLRANGLDDLL
jgi:mannose-1-phosphate guanylyltransferase